MEFFENHKSIGLLQINTVQPKASFVQDQYRYYTNASINSGALGYWIGITSIFDLNPEISFEAELSAVDDFQLIKIHNGNTDSKTPNALLKALASGDHTILKLDSKKPRVTTKLSELKFDNKIAYLTIVSNYIAQSAVVTTSYKRIGLFLQK